MIVVYFTPGRQFFDVLIDTIQKNDTVQVRLYSLPQKPYVKQGKQIHTFVQIFISMNSSMQVLCNCMWPPISDIALPSNCVLSSITIL